MLKLKIYKFLGKFIPYFKTKIMTINYYTGNWIFLQQQTYNHHSSPRVGEKVELFVNGIVTIYNVIDVKYTNTDIKILLS